MSSYNYVVERLEGTAWAPKLRTNFEDPSFYTIAKNHMYRILCGTVDVTAKYRNSEDASMPMPATEITASPMKPSTYKSLSEPEKKALQDQAIELKAAKMKRTDILIKMNVSEATYDAIRADISEKPETASPAPVQQFQEVEVHNTSQPPVNINVKTNPRRGGLLGRR